MTRPLVIGVDPGPIPGIALIWPDGASESLQVTAGIAVTVVSALIDTVPTNGAVIAVERFVVSRRAARSATPQAGAQTRDMVGAMNDLGRRRGAPVLTRTAAQVKPWATDERLERAGLLVKGMPHARDAGRHALYCAVHDTGLPDPLSRRPARSPSAGDPR